MQTPNYQERVTKRLLNQTQPELEVPAETIATETTLPPMLIESSLGRWFKALLMIMLAVFGFAMVDAYLTIEQLLKSHPILGGFLASLLSLLLLVLVSLVFKEWQAVRQLNQVSQAPYSTETLIDKDDRDFTLKTLSQKSKTVSAQSLAGHCFQRFQNTVKRHHSNAEIVQIYQQQVQQPLLKEAKSVLKQESVGAGTVAFVSPNSLFQTLGILWISLRTLKKVAYLYGVRPSVLGNLRLFKIALENLAAISLTDFITDEMANQFGGSISDKLLANSADAITAASLNQRLGKALIKQLNH